MYAFWTIRTIFNRERSGGVCKARRFIWLVDALYEHGCNLFILSAAPAHSLFVDDATTDDHATADIMLQESLGSLLENRLLVEQNESDATQFLDVTKSHIFTGQDDIFSFARCQSRLAEMQVHVFLLRLGWMSHCYRHDRCTCSRLFFFFFSFLQSHAYHQRKHQKDKNRIYNGKPITMPCPPPNFTPDPVDEGDDNIAEEHWAGTHMAPPLELQVEDIRRKVRCRPTFSHSVGINIALVRLPILLELLGCGFGSSTTKCEAG